MSVEVDGGRTELATDEHLRHWREHGYVIVEGWLSESEVAGARAGLERLLPGWLDGEEGEDRNSVSFTFPYAADELNAVTLHLELIAFAERALATEQVTLAHSVVWCKRAGGDDWSGRGFDQPLHMDYENNTLVVPDPADLDQLASITYYTDVTEDLGPTYVVSFQDSAGRHDANFHTRESAPDLYAHERPVAVSAGSILLYNMRTFHRGSAFRAADGIRVSHHVAYQRANCTWTSRNVPVLETAARVAALIPSLAPRQRTVLGFPAPGHPYWTPETIAAVERRYPGIDLSAYAVSGGAT